MKIRKEQQKKKKKKDQWKEKAIKEIVSVPWIKICKICAYVEKDKEI